MTDAETWRRELATERSMKDEFMARHPESPFVAERIPFHPLVYFPITPAYRIRAELKRRATPEEAYLRTNRDGQSVMRYVGDLTFRLGARPLRLRVFHAGEGVGTSVFVPFRDLTSGRETYGPGRYLTLELSEQDDYELDFNRAFNPYCAYTDAYECGFPPTENDLSVRVPAGEKVWAADRNPRTPSALLLERAGGTPVRAAPRPRAARGASPRRRPTTAGASRPRRRSR